LLALNEQRRAYFENLKFDLDKFWLEANSIMEKALDKPLVQHMARMRLNLKQDPKMKSWFDIEARVIHAFLT